jgi:methylenetetrahydrofolate reductase (NADPH)
MTMPVSAKVPPDLTRDVAAFVHGFSIEATRPTPSDIAMLAQAAPAGTAVYLSAIPTKPHRDLIEAAVRVRAAGLEPVPHLAARNFASVSALDEMLCELATRAHVRRILMIAGDRDEPAGEFRSAIEVIETGLLPGRGIEEIGIAGYPDGHPRITTEALDRALAAKIEAAAQTGLAVHSLRFPPNPFCSGCAACVISVSIFPFASGSPAQQILRRCCVMRSAAA